MRRADRILVATAIGAAAGVVVYAIERVVERWSFPEPNPAMLIWSDRSAFVWRAAIALYAAGFATFGGYALASRAPRASGRWLLATIAAAIVAIAAQGATVP